MAFISNSLCTGRRAAVALIAPMLLLLGACTSLPTSPPAAPPARATLDAFALDGRFSLRQDAKNYSGRLNWRHWGTDNTLLLSSPFGQGLAEIVTDAQGARLTTSDGQQYVAADVETLTQEVLGYAMPLDQLTDWVRGRDDAVGLTERDAQGRPRQLRYRDWRVDYGYEGDDPQAPPSRIFAQRTGGLELRLKIDEWNLPTP